MAGPSGHGCWGGGAIWGTHGIDMGGAGIRWASLSGWGAPRILFTVPLNWLDLQTPGRFGGAVGPLDAGASGGGSLHLEMSMGGRSGAGGRYPDIPAAGVLEWSCLLRRQSLCTQVTPILPGSMMEGVPESRLPCRHTWSLGVNRSGNIPIQLFS